MLHHSYVLGNTFVLTYLVGHLNLIFVLAILAGFTTFVVMAKATDLRLW